MAGLNPDVDRFKYVNNRPLSRDYVIVTDKPLSDLKDNFYVYKFNFCENTFQLRNLLFSLVRNQNEEEGISANVFNNSLSIIEALSPSVIEKLDLDNVYVSNSNTTILDWEKDDDVFSLEIGKDSIGYFIEKNGKDVKLVEVRKTDEANIENTLNELLGDLSEFL